MVIEPGLGEQVYDAAAGPGFGVTGAIDDARYSRRLGSGSIAAVYRTVPRRQRQQESVDRGRPLPVEKRQRIRDSKRGGVEFDLR